MMVLYFLILWFMPSTGCCISRVGLREWEALAFWHVFLFEASFPWHPGCRAISGFFCFASLAFLLVQARSFLFLPCPWRDPLASFGRWTGRFGFGLRLKRITGRRGAQLELAGKVRGCLFLAPHLRKSPATERKHTKPTYFLCCEEGNDTSHQVHICLPELLFESHIRFLFGFSSWMPMPFSTHYVASCCCFFLSLALLGFVPGSGSGRS